MYILFTPVHVSYNEMSSCDEEDNTAECQTEGKIKNNEQTNNNEHYSLLCIYYLHLFMYHPT